MADNQWEMVYLGENIIVNNLSPRLNMAEMPIETWRSKKVVFQSSCRFKENQINKNNKIQFVESLLTKK